VSFSSQCLIHDELILTQTHPGTGALEGAPSIAALVGSVEPAFAQFPAILRENARQAPSGDHDIGLPNEEIIDLSDMVYNSLRNWLNHRGGIARLPTDIIVFRDGLSEAQFEMCRTRELPRIKAGIETTIAAGARKNVTFIMPKVMLICTVKRHHTRFFRKDSSPNDRALFDNNQNPVPGCFIDNTVTIGNDEDFYLFSHKAIQGTSKPTHYVVLENEMKASLQDIAQMVRLESVLFHRLTAPQTHSLCYLYQRATRSVSLAPPSYYADLAADRARIYARNVYAPGAHGVYDANDPNHQIDLAVHPGLTTSMNYI
jgi:eukaryotic translation initiation factor 2C